MFEDHESNEMLIYMGHAVHLDNSMNLLVQMIALIALDSMLTKAWYNLFRICSMSHVCQY